jgi:hypothetical protein
MLQKVGTFFEYQPPRPGVANLLSEWANFFAKKPPRAKSKLKKDLAG